MKKAILGVLVLAGVLGALTPTWAQQTTGAIVGRVIDEQKAAVPGAAITAKNTATGFTRATVSDAEGLYRLSALPVGTYDLTSELQGFATIDRKGILVNVSQTLTIDFDLKGSTPTRPRARSTRRRSPAATAATSTTRLTAATTTTTPSAGCCSSSRSRRSSSST